MMKNHLFIFLLGVLLMAALAIYAKDDLDKVNPIQNRTPQGAGSSEAEATNSSIILKIPGEAT